MDPIKNVDYASGCILELPKIGCNSIPSLQVPCMILSNIWIFTFGTNVTWHCALVLLVLHHCCSSTALELLAIENKVYLCSSRPGLHATGHITNSGRPSGM